MATERVELNSPLGPGTVSVPKGAEGRYIERGWTPTKAPAKKAPAKKAESKSDEK